MKNAASYNGIFSGFIFFLGLIILLIQWNEYGTRALQAEMAMFIIGGCVTFSGMIMFLFYKKRKNMIKFLEAHGKRIQGRVIKITEKRIRITDYRIYAEYRDPFTNEIKTIISDSLRFKPIIEPNDSIDILIDPTNPDRAKICDENLSFEKYSWLRFN